MRFKRRESIKGLRKAIQDGSLGMYRGATACLYYEKSTDSHCAVGILLETDVLRANTSSNGDVEGIYGDSTIDWVLDAGRWENNTGLEKEELHKLQRLHDRAVREKCSEGSRKAFEDYVYSLKAEEEDEYGTVPKSYIDISAIVIVIVVMLVCYALFALRFIPIGS